MMPLSDSIVGMKNGIAAIDIEEAAKAFDKTCAIYKTEGKHILSQSRFSYMNVERPDYSLNVCISESDALAIIKKLNLYEFKARDDDDDSKFFIESRR